MSVGSEADVTDLGEQLLEGELGGDPGAEDEGIEEEANQPFRLGAGAVQDGGAHHHVVLPGVPMEEDSECREQRHEEGGALPAESSVSDWESASGSLKKRSFPRWDCSLGRG